MIGNYFFLLILLVVSYLSVVSIRRQLGFPWSLLILLIGAFFFFPRKINLVLVHGELSVPLWVTILLFVTVQFKNKKDFFITVDNTIQSLSLGLVVSLCVAPVSFLWPLDSIGLQSSLNIKNINWLVMTFAIAVSVGEELLFRGAILGYFRKFGHTALISILGQAVIFSLAHTDYIQQRLWGSILFTFIFGVSAGYTTWKTGNITGALLAHIITNMLRFLVG